MKINNHNRVASAIVHAIALSAFMFVSSNTLPLHAQDVPAQDVPANGKSGYEIDAQFENDEVQSAAPVVLIISIKNNSQSGMSYIETDSELVFDINVKNAKGESMPLTRYGKRIMQPEAEPTVFRRILVKLKPGEKSLYKILVNRIYDMSVPDSYSVTAKRRFLPEGESKLSEEVSSQAVVIKVGGFDAS